MLALNPTCFAPGASLRRDSDGSLRYQTRSEMTHLVAPAEVPVCEDAHTAEVWQRLLEIQPNVAELCEALEDLRYARRAA